MAESPDITVLLARASDGNSGALDELMPIVYAELRRSGEPLLAAERVQKTLQPTAIVNEAYLQLMRAGAG